MKDVSENLECVKKILQLEFPIVSVGAGEGIKRCVLLSYKRSKRIEL